MGNLPTRVSRTSRYGLLRGDPGNHALARARHGVGLFEDTVSQNDDRLCILARHSCTVLAFTAQNTMPAIRRCPVLDELRH